MTGTITIVLSTCKDQVEEEEVTNAHTNDPDTALGGIPVERKQHEEEGVTRAHTNDPDAALGGIPVERKQEEEEGSMQTME